MLTDTQIRQIFLDNGFTIKPGQADLKPYVYAAARALLAAAASPPADVVLRTIRAYIEGAWCAGYYAAGYTYDSAFADVEASEFGEAAMANIDRAAIVTLFESLRARTQPDPKTMQFRGVDNTFAPYTGPIEPGMVFVWERDKPKARCVTTVTRVVGDMIYSTDDRFALAPREVSNYESRFREACVPA